MATAILVDATRVRMVLAPALMQLMGRANWWLPSWLDRVLPQLDAPPASRKAWAGATHEAAPVPEQSGENARMRVSAKVDYALRAAVELAAAGAGPTKGERIAQAQGIPLKFLENILLELRRSGLVQSQRGAEGGYWLARPPEEITLAQVIRAVEGPLANVRGARPEALEYAGAARALRDVWIAVRANLRAVLETVTLADVASGELPADVAGITVDPEAWQPH